MTIPMTVAITGFNGFIGQALAAHLLHKGVRVLGLSRQGIQRVGAEDRPVGDHADVPTLVQALRGADVVVHLAARAHQTHASFAQDDSQFDTNLQLTRALLQASGHAGVQRFVHLSSIGVNGQRTQGRPFTESDTPAPAEAYARSKLRCEERVWQHHAETGLPCVVLRPPLVYGPQAPGNFGRLVRVLARGWPLPLAAINNRRHFVGLDNLVDAIALCLTHPQAINQTFLVADTEAVSTPDFLRLAARALHRPARLWPVPVPLLRAAAGIAGQGPAVQRLCDSLEVDNRHIRDRLGWYPPFTLAQGLARAVQTGQTP